MLLIYQFNRCYDVFRRFVTLITVIMVLWKFPGLAYSGVVKERKIINESVSRSIEHQQKFDPNDRVLMCCHSVSYDAYAL